jgi:hypothetical protein
VFSDCPTCGHVVSDDARVCLFCGTKFVEREPGQTGPPTVAEAPAPRRSHRNLILAMVGLAVLLSVVLAAALASDRVPVAEPSTTPSTPTPLPSTGQTPTPTTTPTPMSSSTPTSSPTPEPTPTEVAAGFPREARTETLGLQVLEFPPQQVRCTVKGFAPAGGGSAIPTYVSHCDGLDAAGVVVEFFNVALVNYGGGPLDVSRAELTLFSGKGAGSPPVSLEPYVTDPDVLFPTTATIAPGETLRGFVAFDASSGMAPNRLAYPADDLTLAIDFAGKPVTLAS